MMKSSALFECGPLPHMSTLSPPDDIHVIGVPRPFPFFALFRFHVLRKLKNKKKNGGGLGTRLWYHCITDKLSRPYFLVKQQDARNIWCGQKGWGRGRWVGVTLQVVPW